MRKDKTRRSDVGEEGGLAPSDRSGYFARFIEAKLIGVGCMLALFVAAVLAFFSGSEIDRNYPEVSDSAILSRYSEAMASMEMFPSGAGRSDFVGGPKLGTALQQNSDWIPVYKFVEQLDQRRPFEFIEPLIFQPSVDESFKLQEIVSSLSFKNEDSFIELTFGRKLDGAIGLRIYRDRAVVLAGGVDEPRSVLREILFPKSYSEWHGSVVAKNGKLRLVSGLNRFLLNEIHTLSPISVVSDIGEKGIRALCVRGVSDGTFQESCV